MKERETEFSYLMENVYSIMRLLNKHNIPRHYGTEDELYVNEVHTIRFISTHPGISLGELGEQTHRTKGATSMVIQKLESKGLISKRSAESDVRRYELKLTDKGCLVDKFHQTYNQSLHLKMLTLLPEYHAEDFSKTNEILKGIIRFFQS